jgi:glutaminase
VTSSSVEAITASIRGGSQERSQQLVRTAAGCTSESDFADRAGIGGGMVTVSPGKGALGTFAPPLDKAGNSVKGWLAARNLSHRLGMDLFASAARIE